jgi:hypothetical protein
MVCPLACLGVGRGALVVPVGAEPTSRAFVLDAGARALVALDLESGKRAGVVPIPGSPMRLNQSEDGRYVVGSTGGPERQGRSRLLATDGRPRPPPTRRASRWWAASSWASAELGPHRRGGRPSCPSRLKNNSRPGLQVAGPRQPTEGGCGQAGWTCRQSRDGRTPALLQGLPARPYPVPRGEDHAGGCDGAFRHGAGAGWTARGTATACT